MDKLLKIKKTKKKRLGRGYGSGKGGHTVGRGQKGQKSRRKTPILFEGIKVRKSLLKRLPLQRGKGKLKPVKKVTTIRLERLNSFRAGEKVDLAKLVKAGMVRRGATADYIKIVSGGKLTKKLSVVLPVTATAAREIKKAGGTII
jgi:large subunit ribosomal protein L15